MMRHGKCELCHASADLRDSHFLPKGGYKKSRTSKLKNPNPVVLSGGKAKQSSLQVRDYKFCGECERRFNKGGEAWVLKHTPQDYGEPFKVHTLLKKAKSVPHCGDLLFAQASIPEVDMKKLVYFALSIFWRATRRWSPIQGGRPPQLFLGRHESAIRAFLLGRGNLTQDVAITVAVWPFNKVYSMATPPRRDKRFGIGSSWFYFYAFILVLYRGKKVSAQLRRACASHSPEKFLTLSVRLGEIAKEILRTELISKDLSGIDGMLKEIKKTRSQV
jgi:hypothetical protein